MAGKRQNGWKVMGTSRGFSEFEAKKREKLSGQECCCDCACTALQKGLFLQGLF